MGLSTEERKKIITLLKDMPEISTERKREQILELAGLKDKLPLIDISGETFFAVSQIINYLDNLGYSHIGKLLDTVKDFMNEKNQNYIEYLIKKYSMRTIMRSASPVDDWRGKDTSESIREKIIGENTLRSIAFLSQGIKVSRSVAYIGVNTIECRYSGTGFLITPDILITNNHVIPDIDILIDTIFRFNYEDNFLGEAQPISEYRAKKDGIFFTNNDLDYTIIQIENILDQQWGWLPLKKINKIFLDDRVNIIQHPNGESKQISFQNNFVQYIGDNVVQYVTSTMNGSSGSPVFNDKWEVIALHHAGSTSLSEPTTQKRYFRNEGILISSIINSLPSIIVNQLAIYD